MLKFLKNSGAMPRANAAPLVRRLAASSRMFAAAESCTGGLVASAFAEVPGASSVLWGSFVCYSLEAKQTMLGIDEALLARYGAVSGETASAMLRGALEKSGVNSAVAVTGLAGPSGDGSALPVGTVWIAAGFNNGEALVRRFFFKGGRAVIRAAAANAALALLGELLDAELTG